ncbi:MAG TPA: phage holin family protein [Polyangiaceae bacterium]|nr:phage holin family protein [Polyangiaceae bacterium]
MATLIHLAALSGLIVLLARLLPGVRVRGVGSAVAVAVVFSLLNWLLGWLVTGLVTFVLFLPAIFTFGLLFVIIPLVANAVLLWLTDKFLDSFELRGGKAFWLTALAITVANAVLHGLLNPHHHEIVRRGVWA